MPTERRAFHPSAWILCIPFFFFLFPQGVAGCEASETPAFPFMFKESQKAI